jgi:hypothetical protein
MLKHVQTTSWLLAVKVQEMSIWYASTPSTPKKHRARAQLPFFFFFNFQEQLPFLNDRVG